MPDAKRRAAEAFPPMPRAEELRAASALGMTWRAWVDAGRPEKSLEVRTSGRKTGRPALRSWHPYRSKWEADYAKHLDLRQAAGQIAFWAYEPWKFLIGVNAWYTPDFRVQLPDGAVEWHEVKGYRREAAIVRIKAAARANPQYRFLLVTKVNGEWRHTTIGAK